MSAISTFTGKLFDVFDPRQDQVDLYDIAHALSMNCRFNGHVKQFYSVAEHCVIASMYCPPEFALTVLMHDAGEAYLTDVPRPIKRRVPVFATCEERVLMTIFGALGLPAIGKDGWKAVELADLRMLKTERNRLLPYASAHGWECIEGIDPYWVLQPCGEVVGTMIDLPCWDPLRAKSAFLQRFEELAGQSPYCF